MEWCFSMLSLARRLIVDLEIQSNNQECKETATGVMIMHGGKNLTPLSLEIITLSI
jgi:hypothetical protein